MAPSVSLGKRSGSRLKPPSTDSLDAVGLVSKGDKKLLDHRAQNEYYGKIVERYMAFCARHNQDLDAAMASLPTGPSSDTTTSPPVSRPNRPAAMFSNQSDSTTTPLDSSASSELSTILLALRKLREAVLATSSTTPVLFSQKVHVFSVRAGILAHHPPSYIHSLEYLLGTLHSPSHPLADAEVKEFITYLILDHACRREDMISAFELRASARRRYKFHSQTVDCIFAALLQDNWVVFWRVRKSVDSYIRAIINWAAGRVRRQAIKAVGSAYLYVEADYLLKGCTGEKGWTWEELTRAENLGWEKEGDRIIIKRVKRKPQQKPVESGNKTAQS